MNDCSTCGTVKGKNLCLDCLPKKCWYKNWIYLIFFIVFFYITLPVWGIYKIWQSRIHLVGQIMLTILILIFAVPFNISLIFDNGDVSKKIVKETPIETTQDVVTIETHTSVEDEKYQQLQEEIKIAEQKELEVEQQKQEAKARQQKIEAQFSIWDGSHYYLTKTIKASMNNPNSYEHVSTSYWDMQEYLIVSTSFRGSNAFGGIVSHTVKAKISIEGTILEILEQY